MLKAPPRFPSDQASPSTPADDDETDAAAALFGLRVERAAPPPAQDVEFHLWPENWPIWCVWRDLETQWRVGGMGGRTGLDYAAVLSLVERSFRRRERREAFWLLQGMEEAALHELRELEQRERARH